jgi:hypothetical protein
MPRCDYESLPIMHADAESESDASEGDVGRTPLTVTKKNKSLLITAVHLGAFAPDKIVLGFDSSCPRLPC